MDAMDLLERALEGVPEQTLEIVGADGARQAQPLSRGRGRMERFALYPGAELTRCDYLAEAAPCRRSGGATKNSATAWSSGASAAGIRLTRHSPERRPSA